MNIPSEIHKITFDQTTNRYKLIFKQIGNLEKCVINIVSSDAKNIALSKENISFFLIIYTIYTDFWS